MDYPSQPNDILPQIQALIEAQGKILRELQSNNTATRHLNAREAAKHLGISERLFNERLKVGMWTSYRVGRRRVFRPADLDADLAAFQEKSRYRKSAA
jgi:hypothetical protein